MAPIKIFCFSLLLMIFSSVTWAQTTVSDSLQKAIKALYTPDYITLKNKIIREFPSAKPGKFGEFVPGTDEDLITDKKIMAFTFDACGGKSSGYNAGLIAFLRKERIPATLFVSGLWINANPEIFMELANDPLFEIENHGLNHRLCSVDGEQKYGIIGTGNVSEVIDEMELNERKIERLTGRRPGYFRSATAWTDETCTKIASQLGLQVVSYDILSGDAIPFTSASILCENIVKNARHGAIVIMHFNHPDWFEKEALELAIPELRKRGYSFSNLDSFKLRNKNSK